MKNKLAAVAAVFMILIIIPLIIIYGGYFLFKKEKIEPVVANDVKSLAESLTESPALKTSPAASTPFPVEHKTVSTEINGRKQEINILEIDFSSGRVEIKPTLSHNRIYGFEKLSDIVLRSNAYAAVNAGFFYPYGEPAGMVVIDGKPVTKSTGRYPVFIVYGKSAALSEVATSVWILHKGTRFLADNINNKGKPGEIIVYTPVYGSSNRADKLSTSFIIEDNKVIKVFRGETPSKIPKNGMVVTFFEPFKFSPEFSIGDMVGIKFQPDFGPGFQAYECGSWLVRDGKEASVDKDEWVGLLTNRDPRTAVGIKHDGNVIFITVDGRQPGYSAGLSSRELASYLVSLGIKDAAMLDGGASTQMIIQDKTVNRLPGKGRQRMLGGGIIVKIR